MERLTRRLNNNKIVAIKGDSCDYNAYSFDCQISEERKRLKTALEKLANYEDLEEQGLLVRLPCKVGEKLWCIVNSAIRELRVYRFDMPAFGTTDIVFRYADGFKLERFVGEIGKTVFLTREEAEKKLEEIKEMKK